MLKMQNFRSKVLLRSLFVIMLFSAADFSFAAERNGSSALDVFADLESFFLVDPSLGQILRLHEDFQAYVESGQAGLDKGKQAQEIWLALQQYLAGQDARRSRLENEIMQSADNFQLKAIREMARNVAERERVMVSVYFALRRLAADSGMIVGESGPGGNFKESAQKETGTRIEIEFSPHDALIEVLE